MTRGCLPIDKREFYSYHFSPDNLRGKNGKAKNFLRQSNLTCDKNTGALTVFPLFKNFLASILSLEFFFFFASACFLEVLPFLASDVYTAQQFPCVFMLGVFLPPFLISLYGSRCKGKCERKASNRQEV